MTQDDSSASPDTEPPGELDDAAEAAEPSSDEAGGPAASGEYDPAEGSPDSGPHPTDDDRPGA